MATRPQREAEDVAAHITHARTVASLPPQPHALQHGHGRHTRAASSTGPRGSGRDNAEMPQQYMPRRGVVM